MEDLFKGKYKGIIFDLDGTLLDTIADLGDSMNEILKRFNLPIYTYEEYKLMVGGGFMGLVLNCFPKGTEKKILDEALDLYIKAYEDRYLNKVKPYEEIEEMLDTLNQKGYKMGVNSNKGDVFTKDLINSFFPTIPFVAIYGEREEIPKKPNATAALKIAKSMDLKPDEILYIGDSRTDIQTAQNAGMDSIGVLWGFRGREELSKYGADFIVSEPMEILDIVISSKPYK